MKHGITLMDGAVGTSLWEKTEDKAPVWQYNVTNPRIISELCREYADAGAEIVLANTFGANAMSMKGTPYRVAEIVPAAMELAGEALAGPREARAVGRPAARPA